MTPALRESELLFAVQLHCSVSRGTTTDVSAGRDVISLAFHIYAAVAGTKKRAVGEGY